MYKSCWPPFGKKWFKIDDGACDRRTLLNLTTKYLAIESFTSMSMELVNDYQWGGKKLFLQQDLTHKTNYLH